MFEINALCDNSDIVLHQETWLSDFDVQFLNSINNDFYAKCISSMDSNTRFFLGRSNGVLGILWRKSLGK